MTNIYTEARRFTLVREVDVSGVSGTGVVADGVIWPDTTVTIRWRGEWPSTVSWANLQDAIAVHGHNGATRVEWLDVAGPPPADYASVWTELRGYVAEAVNDGGTIHPTNMLHYLDELKKRALSPVAEWMHQVMATAGPEGSPLEPVDAEQGGEVSAR